MGVSTKGTFIHLPGYIYAVQFQFRQCYIERRIAPLVPFKLEIAGAVYMPICSAVKAALNR